MMLQNILVISGTAVFSSVLTLILAYIFYKMRLKQKLKDELEELSDIMKEKLKAGVEEAGHELMPRFRQEVREGFKEAMQSALDGEIIEQSARSAVRRSSTMVETGLNFLLGRGIGPESGAQGEEQTGPSTESTDR